MNHPDLVSALWIGVIAMLFAFVWRLVAGLLNQSASTETLGKSMLSISG